MALAPAQVAYDSDILYLFVGKFTVGAVDLRKNVPGVDEEDPVILFRVVEKSQGGRQGGRIEHVGREGQGRVSVP
ncbi:conserved hypothetical protein [delta proteobacterium NaphS2]|nr:conserved hypothetical protein [delta proteobacterium NaphS2]